MENTTKGIIEVVAAFSIAGLVVSNMFFNLANEAVENEEIEQVEPEVEVEQVETEADASDAHAEVTPSLPTYISQEEFDGKFTQDPEEKQYYDGKFQLRNGSLVQADFLLYIDDTTFDYASAIF